MSQQRTLNLREYLRRGETVFTVTPSNIITPSIRAETLFKLKQVYVHDLATTVSIGLQDTALETDRRFGSQKIVNINNARLNTAGEKSQPTIRIFLTNPSDPVNSEPVINTMTLFTSVTATFSINKNVMDLRERAAGNLGMNVIVSGATVS